MAFNPYSRRPAERVPVSRPFTDGPDTFTLTFHKPNMLDSCAAVDMANDLIAQFLGTKTRPGPGWPPIGGVSVNVTPLAVQNAAAVAVMQPEDAAERYTAEAFVAFQAVLSPDTWSAIVAFKQEVEGASEDKIPPTSGAATEPSSEPASAD